MHKTARAVSLWLGNLADTLDVCATEKDLCSLEKLINRTLMKFSNRKLRVLTLAKNNAIYFGQAGSQQAGKQLYKKTLGVLVGDKSHQYIVLKYTKLHLNIKIWFFVCFSMRVVKHWKRLPWKTVGSPSLEVIKTQLNMALSSRWSCLISGLDSNAYQPLWSYDSM